MKEYVGGVVCLDFSEAIVSASQGLLMQKPSLLGSEYVYYFGSRIS